MLKITPVHTTKRQMSQKNMELPSKPNNNAIKAPNADSAPPSVSTQSSRRSFGEQDVYNVREPQE